MFKKKFLYVAVAIVGMAALGAGAWWMQRPSKMPGEAVSLAEAGGQGGGAQGRPGGTGPRAGGAGPGAGRAGGGGPVAVEVVAVRSANLQDDVSAVGSIRSNQSVMLRPEVSGRIASINFTDGQPVKKGQVLVALDDSINRAETAQARAELELAQNNLKRTQELAERKFVSERARDESASNVRVLEAKLRLSETRLAKMTVLAPFDGVVGIRNISVGDYVKDGAELVNLEDVSQVKADFRLPERYQPQVRRGQTIELTADALPDRRFRATVEAINPLLDVAGRAVAIRAVAANTNGALRPGMFARVRLIFSEKKGVLMVPEEALVPDGSKVFVFRVVDGKAMRSEVKTGLRREAEVEILTGVKLGDMIVKSGQLRLQRDAMPVRVIGASGAEEGKEPGARRPGGPGEGRPGGPREGRPGEPGEGRRRPAAPEG